MFQFLTMFRTFLLRDKNEKHICFEATWKGSFALEYKFLIKLILPPCLVPPPPPQTYHLQNVFLIFLHISFFWIFCLLFVILCRIQGDQESLSIVIIFWRTQFYNVFRELIYFFPKKDVRRSVAVYVDDEWLLKESLSAV